MIAESLALVGAMLMVVSAVGVLRFRDVLARMHALTKASTLGLLFLLGGAALGMTDANDITSLVLAMALQLLTLPVGSNLIAKATYQAVHTGDADPPDAEPPAVPEVDPPDPPQIA